MRSRTTLNTLFAPLVGMVLMLVSCASPTKLEEIGDYDEAIERTTARLAGKDRKNEDLVRTLESAFAKATERDLNMIDRMTTAARSEDWSRIFDLYQRMSQRENRVRPLTPLVDRQGYRAHFDFPEINDPMAEAREKAAAYHYDLAQDLMIQARQNRDRIAARRAYDEYARISSYYHSYRDVEQGLREARELGTTYVLLDVENRAPVILPIGFDREVLDLSFGGLNDRWRVFHNRLQGNVDYDYKATLSLFDVQVTPATVRESEHQETREIQDGYTYEYDARGQVKRDTAGREIRVPKFITVRANVLQTYQQRAARLNARLEFFDYRTRSVVDTRPLGAETFWENYAATFRGDERALSNDTRQRIGNRPSNFPDDAWMLLDAARRLRPNILDQLRQARLI